MKEVVKITVVLTSVCVFCAFLLSLVYGLANEKIKTNAQEKIDKAIYNIEPKVKSTKKIEKDNQVIYELYDENNTLIGYAFIAKGQGYQGKIKILTVADPDLNQLKGIEIVESVETPGLGSKIQEKSYLEQFENLNISDKITALKPTQDVDKENSQVQTITGATISSTAVINILNKEIIELKKIFK
jgi:electron transport complex protein RnfG